MKSGGPIAELEEAAQFILARERPAKGCVLAPRLADRLQAGVAGKAEDIAAASIFQEFHDLRRAIMAIAAQGDFDARPVAPDAADDVLEDTGRLFPGRPLAGAQERE